MRLIFGFILLLITLFGIIFSCLNAEPVSINYFFNHSTLPLSMLLVITFIIGSLVGWLFGFVAYLRQKAQNHRLTQRVYLAEKELNNLRVIPFRDA